MPVLTSHSSYETNDLNMAVGSTNQQLNLGDGDMELQGDNNDEKILNATIKAFQSGSLMPLIKEELRCTIQSRRLAEGKGELKVEFRTPQKKKEMTDDERARYLKRRVQNREAAQRFRQRQKDTSDKLTSKIQRLEHNAKALLTDLNKLREEKESLKEMLKSHLVVCTKQHSITPIISQNELNKLLSDQQDPLRDIASIPSTSGSCSPMSSSLAATPSPRPTTADSSTAGSDVFFFPDEEECVNIDYDMNPDTEVEVIVTTGGHVEDGHAVNNGYAEQLQTLAYNHHQEENTNAVVTEEVVIDVNEIFKNSNQRTAERLESRSSVDTIADARGLTNSFSSSCSSMQIPVWHNAGPIPADGLTPSCVDTENLPPVFDQSNVIIQGNDDHMIVKNQDQGMTLTLADLAAQYGSDLDLSAVLDNHPGEAIILANGGGSGDAGGLVESTSDLRHSLSFAYSRVHDMCDFDFA